MTPVDSLSPSSINLRSTDREYVVGRCIKVYRFEPHPNRKILRIVGEVTVTIVKQTFESLEVQRTEDFKKLIHLLGLSRSSNIEVVADEILSNCPFLDHSMREKLVETLTEITERDYDHYGMVIHKQMAADGSFLPRYPEIFDDNAIAESNFVIDDEEPEYDKLDEYVELLYEDVSQKIEGSCMIGKLTKCSAYLFDIVRHDTVINALFRILREDCKKSTLLTKNILNILLDFARFKQFQGILLANKIYQLTLDIVDFELERCERWKVQLQALEVEANESASGSVPNDFRMWASLDERINVQNSLLTVSFELLHYLSENRTVREALIEQRVVTSLVDCLERRDKELLECVISYLKDLSCFKQAIDDMVAVDIVFKLGEILKGGFPLPKTIILSSMHLLFNLCFHTELRHRILECDLVAAISKCLTKNVFMNICSKLLYLISMEPKFRSKLAKPSIIVPLNISKIMDHLATYTEKLIPVETGCLIVNLSTNKRCVELIWESNKVLQLVENAIKNTDVLAMKIVRNLAERGGESELHERVGAIAAASRSSTSQEFLAECIGTLAYFDALKVDIEVLTQKGKVFSWVKQTLAYYLEGAQDNPPHASTEMIRSSLDALHFLGTVCQNEDGARLVVGDGFGELLLSILGTHTAELKIVQQALNVFLECSKHESISVYLALKSRIPQGLLNFAENVTNDGLKSLCISAMENISKYDDNWKESLQQYHFLEWNKEWIDAVTGNEDGDDDDELIGILRVGGAGVNLDRIKNRNQNLDQTFSQTDELDSDTECDSLTSEQESFFALFRQQYEEEMELKRRKQFFESKLLCVDENEDLMFSDSDISDGERTRKCEM